MACLKVAMMVNNGLIGPSLPARYRYLSDPVLVDSEHE